MAVRRAVIIHTDTITLGALLKWAQVAATGGQAKEMIRRGLVKVNGVIERRRARQIRPGDVVEVGPHVLEVRREEAGEARAAAGG
ncbi:MAG: RNA-binding S4 domain-containing protein [Armatimonadota bacterium]|nr:RNA-binding S4 domain-containing protein [Armatimonadota bacterium]